MYESTGVCREKKRFRSRRLLLVNVFQWRRSFPENVCNISYTLAYIRVILLPHTCSLSSHPRGGGRAYIAIRDSYALPLKKRVSYIRFLFMRFDRNVSETLTAAVAGRPVYPPHTDGIIIIIKNERTTIKTLRSINRPRRRNHPGCVCVCVCACIREL